MKNLLSVAIVTAAALLLGACATQTPGEMQANLQSQITMLCPTATAEVATLQSLRDELAADVSKAVDDAAPVVATVCAPGFSATSANMATFLPAVTVIAVQYAASHK
jgi:hypothetical protein